jgi:hypothetical protein
MATTEKEKQVPPYIPYKTLKTFLRSLTQGIPPRFEKRMFSHMSGSTQSQLVQTLKALDLMDANWVRTEKLRSLVNAINDEAGYRQALRTVLLEGYPFLPQFDLKGGTLGLLQEELEAMGASGGTVSKCVAFLIPAAKDAGMEVSPFIEKPTVRATNGQPRRRKASSSRSDVAPPPPPFVPPQDPVGVSAAHKMLMDKYPNFDPSWTPEVQAKWFDGFAKLQAALEGKK